MRRSMKCGSLALAVFLAGAWSSAGAQVPEAKCRALYENVGHAPADYRLRHGKEKDYLKLVEDFHFKPEDRRAALRAERANVLGDLQYTLRRFPNHTPALYLIGYFYHKARTENPELYRQITTRSDLVPPACFFDRAARFAPDDPNVWNTLGRLQTTIGEHDKAIESFRKVVQLAPGSAAAQYNLGLAYYAAGKYPESAAAARKAYSMGYRKQDLRRRLVSKGHWE